MNIFFGIVENRSDPLELGRCQVRVVSLHTHDKNLLPTSDLPWCATMQPSISAAMNGIGHTPIGPVEGTSVVVTYLDDNMQQGLILGAVGGIATEPVPIDFDDSGPILSSNEAKKTILRTIAGPVTGNKLKFYDPNSSRTNLTSDLQANMRVSGYNITDGTTIVSIDSGTQITISTEVRDYGENILEFLPPLSNAAAIVESKTLVSASTVSDKADDVKPSPVNTTIPTIPPPKSTTNQTKASEGIKALIAACDKVGLTTKEQKCAVLGICGGESGWIPQLEKYSYTPERLKEIFPSVTDENIEKYSYAPKKGMSRQDFFSFFYGPTFRGKNFLGHKTDAEGGLYFGRGFIQLTGKSNYETFQNEAKKYGVSLDLVNNPDSLDADINTSALIAALYVKKRTPSSINPNSSPGFFEAAKNAVGHNSKDIAATKLKYYNYFYGEESNNAHIKDAGAEPPGPPTATIVERPGPSDKAITSGSFGIGFRDPNNKYPLKEYLNESDVNRLARGVIKGTVVDDKDARRKIGIPKPFLGTWSQPIAPFAAQYPFNKVFESESGHVQEWDDTPGNERVNTYHRSGTFTEIDTNGTQVNYIIGDNYILMENNGCIHVAGECNITVDGNVNLLARSDVNAQVSGNAKIEVGNNADIGVNNDMTLAVGGNMETYVAGQYKVTAEAGMEFVTGGSLAIQSDQATSIKAGDLFLESSAGYALKAAKAIAFQAGTNIGLKAGKNLYTTASGGSVNIKASGPVKLDGSTFLQQSGAAGSAANVDGVSAVDPLSLTPPTAGEALYSAPDYLVSPERQFENAHPIETPDDWNTPEGRAVLGEKIKSDGVAIPVPVAPTESSASVGGTKAPAIPADCALIYTTKDFTNDYRLTKNFSLGMLIAGGVNGRHKLQSQMLKANKQSNERLYTVQEIVCNLAQLATNVLEPALEVLPQGIAGYNKIWYITSGYRLKGVVTNESPTSDHCKGHCVDITLGNGSQFYQPHYEMIKKLDNLIRYDQLILEYDAPNKNWIHIGYKPEGNRKMAFTMTNHTTSGQGFILFGGIESLKK